ncbi:MAG TPA: ABC transporter permease [Blastocatellia bacterium]|jgi:putative ABC transport system permease protein|nr:ABC transporter permease [Blastocatellia bacterium]
MERKEIFASAIAALLAHKQRSALALLGIVVGISALVAIVALIEGANAYIAERLITLQPDVLQVSQLPASLLNVNDFIKASKWKRIEYDDYLAVRGGSRECAAVGAESDLTGRLKWRNTVTGSVQIRGLTAGMFEIERVEVATGRFYSETEEQQQAAVCLIGADVADDLFGREDPLGAVLTVMGKPFQVIGTVARRGALFGRSQDRFVVAPLATILRRFGAHQSVTIYCQQRAAAAAGSAVDEVRSIMRRRRQVLFNQDDTFFVTTADSAAAIYENVIGGFYLVTFLISGVALTVGGLGVTNIMLVSVRERTREIGLRKAVGARRRDLLLQFLVEAVALCLVGGALGTAAGLLIARLIAWVTPLPASSRPLVALLGFAVSSALGLAAGLYPARRAADLSPIEALRYE